MMSTKQVKVDNWGIFFLQQLKHFFNKTYFCDLTLQFEDNVQLKVHRLVLNACTEYFNLLEQTCDMINDCLIMPSNLQADVVVPIVNFMYTGILEFPTAIFDRLYNAAQLMNMSVLTKLLDAQKVPITPLPKRKVAAAPTFNLHGKKIQPKILDPDFPEPLPGRKLPIWKRKSVPPVIVPTPTSSSSSSTEIIKSVNKNKYDDTPRPSRFEWPDEEDGDNDAGYESKPFDEISYMSKPLLHPMSRDRGPKPSTSNFEELKRASTKRAHSPVAGDNKRVNIQDVKEYLREHRLRSDYIEYDEAEATDNDLQTFTTQDEEDSDGDRENKTDEDDASNRSILKTDGGVSPSSKRVRFNLEGKENAEQKASTSSSKSNNIDMSNHTKIITEVLKKYPHLVKKNKNIRLKILAKGTNINSSPMKPLKVVKPAATSKVSYMVMKPDDKKHVAQAAELKETSWTCIKCAPNIQFDSYHLYRNHLTEVHNEKSDSQMCNICGHKSRKVNMLMYHKFVKHNIPPPPLYQFPKCAECPYIAISPNILVKHQYNHMHLNLVCKVCRINFQSKLALSNHIQATGHFADKTKSFDCTYCTEKFDTDEILFQHIKKHHTDEARRDNLISQDDDLLEMEIGDEAKEKIKILSDIKINKTTSEQTMAEKESQQPSSEAESLSNVASGIAASLGLVNTIVVLDDNQYILQDEVQEITTTSQSDFILPNITTIPNLHMSQQDPNHITQPDKNNIQSTDELVMVLTDHDYSDATANTVISGENSNIVVLYSHPVQGEDGQFMSQPGDIMINSDMRIMQVNDQFIETSVSAEDDKPCEESIEMIQREINNHKETEIQELQKEEEQQEVIEPINENLETEMTKEDDKMDIESEFIQEIQQNQIEETQDVASSGQVEAANQFEEPMEIEESIEMIQQEINKDAKQLQESNNKLEESVEEIPTTPEPEPTEESEEITNTENELKENESVEPQEDNVQDQDLEQMEVDSSCAIVEQREEETEKILDPPPEQNLVEMPKIPILKDTSLSEPPSNNLLDESFSIEALNEKINQFDENVEHEEEFTESPQFEETQEVFQIQDNIEQTPEVSDQPEGEELELSEEKLESDSIEEIQENQNLNNYNETDEIHSEVIEEKEEIINTEVEPIEENTQVVVPNEETISQVVEDNQNIETYNQTEEILTSSAEMIEPVDDKINEETSDDIKDEASVSEVLEEPSVENDNNEANIEETLSSNESEEIKQENDQEISSQEEMPDIKITSGTKLVNPRISNLLDDWDDGDTDSLQSETSKTTENKIAINTLINDWEDDDDT